MPTIDWQSPPFPGRTLFRNVGGAGHYNVQHPASLPPEHRGDVKTTQNVGQRRSRALGAHWSRYQFELTDPNGAGPFPVVVVFSAFTDLMKDNLLNLGVAKGRIAALARIKNLADGQLVYSHRINVSESVRGVQFHAHTIGDMDFNIININTGEYQVDLFSYASVSLSRNQIYPARSAKLTLPNDLTSVQVFTL